jgi:hypothetical protein
MLVAMDLDPAGHLVCTLSHGQSEAFITSSQASEALADLAAALDDTARDGCGECYWLEGGGDYRWMFRRNGANISVVVLWCTNPVKGWENVFWSEDPYEMTMAQIREQVDRHRIPAV